MKIIASVSAFILNTSGDGEFLFLYFIHLNFHLATQPEQHTWSALVGNKKVLGGERTGVLSKHWTEDRDVTRVTVLTL